MRHVYLQLSKAVPSVAGESTVPLLRLAGVEPPFEAVNLP
jgi:hypothetical protein